MKIIRNRFFPFDGFKAMNVFGVLFVKKGALLNATTLNHERIHSAQIQECMIGAFVLTSPFLFFGLLWVTLLATAASFYLLYALEWVVKSIMGGKEAYYRLSFEREAYSNQDNGAYLNDRKWWAWTKYL